MYAETIICKLYEARTDLGLTQQQVADGADMNVRTLINIEKGRSIPSLLFLTYFPDADRTANYYLSFAAYCGRSWFTSA